MIEIVKACQYLLSSPDGESCLIYLDKRISKESQELWEFGYFPNSSNIGLLTSLINKSFLKENGLIWTREINDTQSPKSFDVSFFENHPLVMPYKDSYGHIIGLVGRSFLSDKDRNRLGISKYKNTTFFKGDHLFGLNESKEHIVKSNFVYLVEGQFDLIKAFEKGLKNVVAVGNASLTDTQLSLICRYTNNIILLFDNDEAGNLGREKILSKYGGLANFSNEVYIPRQFKDIDEYFSSISSSEDIELCLK